MARQVFFGKKSAMRRDAGSLVGGNLQKRRILAGDLGHGDVAQKADQLASKVGGAVAFAEQFVDQHENFLARTIGDGLHHGFKGARWRGTDQVADRIEREMTGHGSDGLIENRERIAHGAIAGFGEQSERIVVGGDFFLRRRCRGVAA